MSQEIDGVNLHTFLAAHYYLGDKINEEYNLPDWFISIMKNTYMS